jgi:exonuclease SbcD
VSHIIKDLAQKLDSTVPAVLASHMTVSSGIFSGSEKRAIYGNDPVLLPSQLAIEPFDYVALGHLHRFQNLNANGHIPIVYSGSIERVDFGERKEDKGFCVVSIPSKGKAQFEFIKTPQRPFIQIEVELNAERNQTDQIIDAIRKHDITDAVIKILYTLPADRKDFVDLKVLQKILMPAMHIVGIIPVRIQQPRERRATMQVSMSLPALLDTYFESKLEWKTKKDDLIKKAILLFEESKEQQEDVG